MHASCSWLSGLVRALYHSAATNTYKNLYAPNMHATKSALLHGIDIAMLYYAQVTSIGAESAAAQYTLSNA